MVHVIFCFLGGVTANRNVVCVAFPTSGWSSTSLLLWRYLIYNFLYIFSSMTKNTSGILIWFVLASSLTKEETGIIFDNMDGGCSSKDSGHGLQIWMWNNDVRIIVNLIDYTAHEFKILLKYLFQMNKKCWRMLWVYLLSLLTSVSLTALPFDRSFVGSMFLSFDYVLILKSLYICRYFSNNWFSPLMFCRSQDFSAAKFDDRTVIICDQVSLSLLVFLFGPLFWFF